MIFFLIEVSLFIVVGNMQPLPFPRKKNRSRFFFVFLKKKPSKHVVLNSMRYKLDFQKNLS